MHARLCFIKSEIHEGSDDAAARDYSTQTCTHDTVKLPRQKQLHYGSTISCVLALCVSRDPSHYSTKLRSPYDPASSHLPMLRKGSLE
ncbi:hypothetical protein KQX54_007823 [Cotesia glomerata]|uniref:Uncharacterized protein n=1 Tax=Cotesia glomerata TaxID=32391 RepID=A0AAV7J3L9_COTGL|nr:hypothetical protein KQX54_007823 [Cotesia glomerata]